MCFRLALVAIHLLCDAIAQAQDYPPRYIRVIVGPGPDIVARLFGPKITDTLGQQVVVEPRPGAGGVIAAQAVANAPPDGYNAAAGHRVLHHQHGAAAEPARSCARISRRSAS